MSTQRNFANVLVEVAAFTTADAYAEVVGTMLDSLRFGSKWLSYNVVESNNKGATVKIQGSIDGITWVDLRVQDNTGTAFSSADVAVSGNANSQLFITDDDVTNSPGVHGGYRFYRMQAKSTVGSNAAKIAVVGIAK
jgi:uncharacterized protein YraI